MRRAGEGFSRWQQKLNELTRLGNGVLQAPSFGPGSSRFEARASGQDEQALRQASDLIVATLQRDSELSDVQSDLAAAKPQLSVDVSPEKASAHGLSPRLIAQIVAQALSPMSLGNLGGGGPPVSLRLDPASVTVDRLGDLPVGPGATLKDVATITNQTAPNRINPRDGTRLLPVRPRT